VTGSVSPLTGRAEGRPSVRTCPASHRGSAVGLFLQLWRDLDAVVERDASRSGRREALWHAPWQGLALHRIAHRRYARGHRLSANALTWLARIVSGMEIHAGAEIGERAFIDHGFGVVIGETAVVGDDVTLYHQVTLGSRGWLQDGPPDEPRHPAIGDRVLIGVGASVLGAVTVGDDCHIRAHTLVLEDVPERHESPKARRTGT